MLLLGCIRAGISGCELTIHAGGVQVYSERDLPSVVNASIELEVGEHSAGQRAYPPVGEQSIGASIMASIAASLDEDDAPIRVRDGSSSGRRAPAAGVAQAEQPGMEMHGGDDAARAEDEKQLAEGGRWAPLVLTSRV